MLWTDETVETLKRLAGEGRSASAIAAALGAASRNAVIGKASRLGVRLNGGRGSASGGSDAPRRARAGADAAVMPRRTAWRYADAEVGEMRRLRLAEMRGDVCRWPLGDPASGDFAYCGLAPVEGRSYCAGHCRLAYRPPDSRPARTPRRHGALISAWN